MSGLHIIRGGSQMIDNCHKKPEKRRYWRVRMTCPIRYRLIGEESPSDEYKESETFDISCGGLQFNSNEIIPLHQMLEVEIDIPEIPDPLKLRAKVVGIQELGETEGIVGIRIAFENLGDQERETLTKKVELRDIGRLLKFMVEKEASDLHLTLDTPPTLRINNKLVQIGVDPLKIEDLKRMIYSIMNEEQRSILEKEKELDYGFSIPRVGRWRVNVHIQRGSVEAAYRLIPGEISTIKELGLPDVVNDLTGLKDGLIIVAGPTGSGKSTTLAAILDTINANFGKVVVTVEDPIEYVHTNKNCIIKQREVGSDTISFSNALRHVLRQDPDVILIGECRDVETMSIALTAAETGHLVLTTLHTSDATQTLHRVVDFFPIHNRDVASLQLSAVLQGIICQKLLPREDVPGLVVATEVLVANPSIRAQIRENKYEQIPTAIQTGGKSKMHLMDTSLGELYRQRLISKDVVKREAKAPEEILQMRQVYKPDILEEMQR